MLMSARKIEVRSKTFQLYDGFMLSPVININGLMVSAANPIDQRIKDFIESKGGKINRMRIAGELLIRLVGEFNITHQEVQDFISGFIADGGELPVFTDTSLPNFTKIIESDLKKEKVKGSELLFSNGIRQLTVKRPFFNNGTLEVNSPKGSTTIATAGIFIGKKFDCIARELYMYSDMMDQFQDTKPLDTYSSGKKVELPINNGSYEDNGINIHAEYMAERLGVKVGYMGTCYSKGKVTFTTQRFTSLRNQSVSCVEEILLNCGKDGNLTLEIDKSVEWLNNPYPDQFNESLNHSPGNVKLLLR